MSRLAAALLALLLLPAALLAQDRPNTILVIDGSGSMWGQIDGVNKIVIAREVVAGILADFPADENLGLTVYGHRSEGDCSDIETVVPPAPGTAPAIVGAVNAINPRGRTPMTDAVIAAAEALGYRDAPATVILVSDGIETCNPDPCAAARALERAGADFTAHVIGFDVADATAIAQLQCLAGETGGVFLSAANADELSAALSQVAVAPEPEPEPEPVLTPVTLQAIVGEGGPLITDPVFWTIAPAPEGTNGTGEGNPLSGPMQAGSYTITATWSVAEQTRQAQISLLGPEPRTVTVVFEAPLPTATLQAPETAVAGSTIEVAWDGPDAAGDFIATGHLGEGTYATHAMTRDGAPARLRVPSQPGTYELRYVLGGQGAVLATQVLTVTPATATLVAPDTAVAGSTIEVAWDGPDYQNDFIAVSRPDDDGWENYTYTRTGAPLELLMPTEPGTYEIRYIEGQDRKVLATIPITLTPVTAMLDLPDSAVAGSDIAVAWDGPDYRNDYIAVSRPDDDGWENYTYTRQGSPLDLTLPTAPGTYEVRYYLGQDRRVIARAALAVESVAAELTAPETAIAGSDIEVAWQGPDYQNDFVAVAVPGEDGWVNYTYTREGSPLDLTLPTEPGTYELRYILQQDRSVLAARPIEVTEVTASLQAPSSAVVGATIEVAWDGPDYHNDFITVSESGSDRWVNYTYTREGSPLDLAMPPEPGAYEIRYVLQQDRKVIATAGIEVADLTVTLEAPDSAPAGGTVAVGFDGPAYPNDLITITAVGADRHASYAYADRGNPAELDVPEAPGDYEIRYVMQQGKRQMASVPFRVEPAE